MREMYAGEQPWNASWRWLRPEASRADLRRSPTAFGSSTWVDFCLGIALVSSFRRYIIARALSDPPGKGGSSMKIRMLVFGLAMALAAFGGAGVSPGP